jgi:hypothetical protein
MYSNNLLEGLHISTLTPFWPTFAELNPVHRAFDFLVLFIIVPHSQSGAVPMSSLSGVGQLGLWKAREGGIIG